MEAQYRLNLGDTLISLEEVGGMEGDKQVILHYLDLIQLSIICRRNGERRRDRINLRETLNSLEGAGGME